MVCMSVNLATWLNSEVDKRGWTLRYAARRSGISHTTLIRLANGESHPTAKVCQGLAAAFGVSIEEIYRMAGLLPGVVTDHSLEYHVGNNLSERLARAFGRLDLHDQERLVDLAERLAGIVQARIIGDEGE
jgi:transcriptional regulator with XRE-family HTH domain